MAYQLTPWGYEVDGTLPPLIDTDTFDAATGGRWSGDARASSAIAAASAAVRNACGWHVAPSMACRATLDVDGMRSLWLPARCVTGVTSLSVGGDAVTDYEWSAIGQVRPAEQVASGLRAAVVEYAAGVDASALAAICCGIANRALALAPGVTSETAGGVSVSYAASTAIASSVPYLTPDELSALAPYRVVMAHAT